MPETTRLDNRCTWIVCSQSASQQRRWSRNMRWPDSFPDICLHHSSHNWLQLHSRHTAQHYMLNTMTVRRLSIVHWNIDRNCFGLYRPGIVRQHNLDTKRSLHCCYLDTDLHHKLHSFRICSREGECDGYCSVPVRESGRLR